jgi:hypothetical protein
MAYISTAQRTRKTVEITVRTPNPIPLDGVAIRYFLYTAEGTMSLRLIRAVYVEASSSATGVNIHIGKIGHPAYFATYISEVSKAQGFVAEITKFAARSLLAVGETLTIDCDGGKAGVGMIDIQIELEGYR